METIHLKIRAIRMDKALKQSYVADAIGVCLKTYRHIEAGKSVLTYERLKAIAKALGSTVYQIESHDLYGEKQASDITKIKEELTQVHRRLQELERRMSVSKNRPPEEGG